MDITIHSYTGGHVFTNGYLIVTEQATIAIDAPARMSEWAEELGLNPTHLLLTHQHFDHVEDVEAFQKSGTVVWMHSPYSETLIRQKEARENWGLPVDITPFEPNKILSESSNIEIGGLSFKISHVPGHSPDSITFYSEQLDAAFVGDTLMAGGTGRTDLPGGSSKQLFKGIEKHLLSLPEKTEVYSGHGPVTTIGKEKQSNQILYDMANLSLD